MVGKSVVSVPEQSGWVSLILPMPRMINLHVREPLAYVEGEKGVPNISAEGKSLRLIYEEKLCPSS